MRASHALKIDPRDNTAVALQDLDAGDTILLDGAPIILSSPVPAKHKFSCEDLPAGGIVRMYGVVVGKTTRPVARGEALTTGNLLHDAEPYAWRENHPRPAWSPPGVAPWQHATFDGYHRSDGSVGTANVWIIVPLVFCENRNIELLRDAILRPLGYGIASPLESLTAELVEKHHAGVPADVLRNLSPEPQTPSPPATRPFPNIDGIRFLTHGLGCGTTDDDTRTICGLIAGYITHPNVAGATVLSLGCEKAEIDILHREINKRRPTLDRPLIVLKQQDFSSDDNFLATALKETFLGLNTANNTKRQPAPLSKLTLGLECGGSDGFSGLSANPAIGHTADLLVALGGSTVLSEFPELCGVEQELIDRAVSRDVADRFIQLMQSYAARAEALGSALHMNPSPGNIRDGLITDAIKSAGAARKGGTSPVIDVLDYPGCVRKPGLTLLCTPGSDLESTTALAGAHANLILFSTGLGTPTGNAVAPTIKISSNSTLAGQHPEMIDLDAGPIIDGALTIPAVGEQILNLVIDVASGRAPTKADLLGQHDFLPWKRGLSL